jgi:hypothetical protein
MTRFARTSSATTSGASFTSRSGSHRASPSFGECPWNLISTKNKNSFQKLELVLSENPSPTVSVTGGELNGNRDLSSLGAGIPVEPATSVGTHLLNTVHRTTRNRYGWSPMVCVLQ